MRFVKIGMILSVLLLGADWAYGQTFDSGRRKQNKRRAKPHNPLSQCCFVFLLFIIGLNSRFPTVLFIQRRDMFELYRIL